MVSFKAALTEDEFNEAAESIKESYTKTDKGHYILNVDPVDGYALEDVKGLKNAYSAERQKNFELKESVKKWGDLNPDQVTEDLEKLSRMKNWRPDEEVEKRIAEMKKEIEEQYKGKINTSVEEKDLAIKDLEKMVKRNAAIEAIRKHEGNPKLLMPIVESKLGVRKTEGGEYITFVLDENGKPAVSLKPDEDHVKAGTLVGDMRNSEDYAQAFKGSELVGSGAEGSGDGGGMPTFRLTEQEARDPRRYRQAKADAEKAGRELEIV